MSRIELPAKSPDATQNIVFDFTSMLAAGATIISAGVTATVYSGTDASPSAIVNGSSVISSQKVTQSITAGVDGTIYDLECEVSTSDAQVLQLGAYLAVARNLP